MALSESDLHDAAHGARAPGPGRDWAAWIALSAIGLGWGSSQAFAKVATSTGHPAIGLAFVQVTVGVICFSGALLATGRRLPLGRRALIFYLVCGLIGTALPHSLSLTSIRYLPVGVQAIVLSSVPMMTLLIAAPLGIDRADPRRLTGLGLGMVAVLLIALPEASLPRADQAAWVAVPCLVALCYAGENVYIAHARPATCDAVQVMAGLSWGGMMLLAPAMLAAGAWPAFRGFGAPEQAILASSLCHVGAYFGLVWLIGRAGPIFAAQVGYVVTAAGVAWGMLFMGERHSVWIWAALILMMAGLALVKPRPRT